MVAPSDVPPTRQKGEPVIRVVGVDTGYDGVPILEGIDFDVRHGEVFGILGGSGSGKSTLMKNMIGLLPPISGHVYFGDDDLWAADDTTRKRIVSRFGVMYQSGALFGSMTLLENVRLPLETATDLPDAAIDLIARMKLELVGLEAFTGHLPAELSGGMQKRAGIARAMALDPEILILDEPFSGLDPINVALMRDYFLDFRARGKTIVFCTHVLEQAEKLCDEICLMARSKKILEGSLKELKRRNTEGLIRLVANASIAEVGGLPGVDTAKQVNGAFVVTLAPGVDQREFLKQALDRLPIEAFSRQEPDLEEIYLEAVKNAGLEETRTIE